MPNTEIVQTSVPKQKHVPPSPAYAVLPPRTEHDIVMIHEIFGPQPKIERIMHRFANTDYTAVAPDLFASTPKPMCVYHAIRAIHSGQDPQLEQIRNVRAWLCDRTGIAMENIALIGFCIDNGFALAAGHGQSAMSNNYNDVPPEEVLTDIGPMIRYYNANDHVFKKSPIQLEQRLPKDVPHEIHVFQNVGHSFLTDEDHPMAFALTKPMIQIRYDPEVAEETQGKILGFFDRHLRPKTPQSQTQRLARDAHDSPDFFRFFPFQTRSPSVVLARTDRSFSTAFDDVAECAARGFSFTTATFDRYFKGSERSAPTGSMRTCGSRSSGREATIANESTTPRAIEKVDPSNPTTIEPTSTPRTHPRQQSITSSRLSIAP